MKSILLAAGLALPVLPAAAQDDCRQRYDVVTGRVYGCGEDTGPRYSNDPSLPASPVPDRRSPFSAEQEWPLLTAECAYKQIRAYAFAHPEEHVRMPTFEGVQHLTSTLGPPTSLAEVDSKCLMTVQMFVGQERALRSIGGW